MKRRFAAAFVSLIVAVCLRAVAFAGTTGSITGHVTDADTFSALANVTIEASSPSQSVTTTTDETGHFTFISLLPDRYTILAQKRGYDPTIQQSVSVFADNTRAISLSLKEQLRDIAHVHIQAAADLVRPGTGADVYSVDRATAQDAQALGGGGGLNNIYSALASLPGVFVPQGQKGWFQAVYVRGADYDAVGYEYDGVPVNRAFDNYDGATGSNVGQQQLQLYTSGGPASASATGIAGFINQVIRTGTSPGFAGVDAQIGAPAFYHKLGVEAGGASGNRRFSYYAGFSGYNQDYRLVDQFNGGGVAFPYFASPIMTPGFQSHGRLAGGAAPACVNGAPPATLPTSIALPACYTFAPGNLNSTASISDREAVVNLHYAIPHKYDTSRDDVQVLANASALDTYAYDSQLDVGTATIQNAFGGPLPWADAVSFPPGTAFGEPVSSIPITNTPLCFKCAVYYFPSSPRNRIPFAALPLDKRGGQANDAAILKIQYQKSFGSSAYLRLFGYTFYSDYLQNDPNGASATYGLNPDYELVSHTRGLGLQFAKQLNARHLLEATMNYTTASTARFYNFTMFTNSPAAGMTNLLDASGNCYASSGSIAACNDGANQGSFANPAPYTAVGAAGRANALWTVTGATGGLPEIGPYNTVTPRFTSMSVEDQFKPNDRFFLDVGLRYERFGYVLPAARSAADDFWFSAAQREFCYDPQTLRPDIGVATLPEAPCPINTSTSMQEVHPDGKDGHLLITNQYDSYMTTNVISPRIAFTDTVNPLTVLRASYGRYAQPTDSAVTQYLFKGANLPSFLFPFFWRYRFTSPRHDVLPQVSDTFDASLEHRIKGTTLSFKVTPFLRQTSHQQQFLVLDAVTGFVSALNVGRQKSSGVEVAVSAGDFTRDGFAASLAYTYTNASIRFDDFAGSRRNAIDIVNDQIRSFNGFTATGGGFPCYQNTTSGSGAGETAAQCGSDPQAIANPYFKMATQPLFDRNAAYYPYDVLATAPGAATDSFFSPHVFSGVLQYKRGKLSVSPSFELNAGTHYGAPLNIPGINPSSCGQNSATAGIAAPDPRQAEYTSCAGFISIPNPENGNRYDGFGQYRNPWHLSLNLQTSYAISPKLTATLVLANAYNRCFGGSVTPWSKAGPTGKHGICGYNGNFAAPYVSNLYNGYGPSDATANGGPLNPYIAHTYAATGFVQPFQGFLQLDVKL